MEEIVLIVSAFIGMTLSVVNVTVQNAKRTVNKWSRELLETGKINSRETSEIGTIYSNPFTDWLLEVDKDNQFQILRNHKIREKIRAYKKYKRLRDRLLLIFFFLLGVSFYMFIN